MKTNSPPSPFYPGGIVPAHAFVGRATELNEIINSIARGESRVILSETRTGKTSLLHFLYTSAKLSEIQKQIQKHFFVAYLDASEILDDHVGKEFWSRSLSPLNTNNTSSVSLLSGIVQGKYRKCVDAEFELSSLKELLRQLRAENAMLVLLLDQFDDLVRGRTRDPEFFARLRGLLQSPEALGALSLIVTSRVPRFELEDIVAKRTRQRLASPVFNHLGEIYLKPFRFKEREELLSRSSVPFSNEDKRFVEVLAGGHPYLNQVIADSLNSAYLSELGGALPRWQTTFQNVASRVRSDLDTIWQRWSSPTRYVFTSLALDYALLLFAPSTDHSSRSHLRELNAFRLELETLEAQGLIEPVGTEAGAFRVHALCFAAWILGILRKHAQSSKVWMEWLHSQNWFHVLDPYQELFWCFNARQFITQLPGNIESSLSVLPQGFPWQKPDVESEPTAINFSNSSRRCRIALFHSYSTKDKMYVDELEARLASFVNAGIVELFAKEHSQLTVAARILWADIILLLISPDFFASSHCVNTVVRDTMDRVHQQTARVIPILIRPTEWKSSSVAVFKALPDDTAAISEWKDRDKAWLNVTRGIQLSVQEFPLSTLKPL